jgi:hypothetical protein
MPKSSVKRLDNKRLSKAKHVPQSKLISHFGPVTSDSFTPTGLPKMTPVAPAVAQSAVKPSATSELLEKALRNATSHEQKPLKKPRRHSRRVGIAAASLAGLAALGVLASTQLPNLRLHMASAKAGFHVGLPGDQPAGYSLKQLNYGPGTAATTFRSNTDDRVYTITQKSSEWDSAALRDSFVAPADPHYQTVESGGRTIYIYGNHNATWVNAGVWYVIQSNGSLSQHQLVDLATSL